MCTHSTTPIPLLVTINPNFLCQKGIGIPNYSSDIEIVAKVAANNSKIMPLGVKISEDRLMAPIVIVVDDVSGFNRSKRVLDCNGRVVDFGQDDA